MKIILFSNEVPGIGSWKSSHPYLVDQNNWSFSCKNNVVEKFLQIRQEVNMEEKKNHDRLLW